MSGKTPSERGKPMGAFKVDVMLHDRELEEFVRQALADELTPEAHYVASRICDQIPEVRPEGWRP